ncbi:unnamed protein product, partial [Amoebophrya sp. A25]|eukprot:GSA25T00008403001.1
MSSTSSATMSSHSHIVLVVGLPGAGKSFFCSQMKTRLATSEVDLSIHEFDAVERQLGTNMSQDTRDQVLAATSTVVRSSSSSSSSSSFSPEVWRAARASVLAEVKRDTTANATAFLDEAGKSSTASKTTSSSKKIHLLDDNFYLRSMRKPYFQLARDQGGFFKMIVLKPPLETCLLRNSLRAGRARVPQSIITHMSEVIEWPLLDNRGTWESKAKWIEQGEEEDDETFLDRATAFLVDESPDYIPPKLNEDDMASGEAEKQPETHLLDNRCRKLVALVLRDVKDPALKPVLAKELGVLKKEMTSMLSKQKQQEQSHTSDSGIMSSNFTEDELCEIFYRKCRALLSGYSDENVVVAAGKEILSQRNFITACCTWH